jgi:hypothetical protein
MANSLLDFVVSIVRDPDAAARYAADPSQAIADAHLTDVTTADVNNLIPVVSESFPAGIPGAHGVDTPDHNIWASGAATAAFDAFSDHVPEPMTDTHVVTAGVVEHPVDQPPDHSIDPGPGPELHTFDAAGLDQPTPSEDPHVADDGAGPIDPGAFGHHLIDDHGFAAEHPSFDIFE